MNFAKRVASRYFDERYAKVLLAMSLQEAKGILGFPPNYNPTPEEIAKSYRIRALQNHPDRGGDLTKMVEVNVAKDILEGKSRHTWTPVNPERPAPAPAPAPQRGRWQDDPEVKVVDGQDFMKAMSSSGIPNPVEWKFVSAPGYYYKKSYYPGEYLWIMYGETDSKRVFLALKFRAEGNGTIPTDEYGPKTHFNDDWQAKSIEVPRTTGDPLKVIPKNIRALVDAWPESKFDPPKKWTAWAGGHPTAQAMKKLQSKGIALKDILVGTGVVQEGSAGVGKRKTQVEIVTEYSREKEQRAKASQPRIMRIDQYDMTVRVNGKEQKLSDETVKNLERRFIPWALTWDRVSDKMVTNITNMRGGRRRPDAASALRMLVDALTSEPSWLHIALEKAAEEYEPESKTASIRMLCSKYAMADVAYYLNMTPLALFNVLHVNG